MSNKGKQTNQPLPMHFVDIKPHGNNKKVYKTSTLWNTTVQFEAPNAKREIPPCMRYQKYGHPNTTTETAQDG